MGSRDAGATGMLIVAGRFPAVHPVHCHDQPDPSATARVGRFAAVGSADAGTVTRSRCTAAVSPHATGSGFLGKSSLEFPGSLDDIPQCSKRLLYALLGRFLPKLRPRFAAAFFLLAIRARAFPLIADRRRAPGD